MRPHDIAILLIIKGSMDRLFKSETDLFKTTKTHIKFIFDEDIDEMKYLELLEMLLINS